MGIQEYRSNSYEIGIVLPTDLDDTTDITKYISQFERLIIAITEVIGEKQKAVKINRLSNGSLEFFSPQSVEVALEITNLLLNIVNISSTIISIRKESEKMEVDQSLSSELKKDMKKAFNDEINRIRKRVIDELPKEILKKHKKESDNDLSTRIRFAIKAVFRWIEIGIELDVTPIRLKSSEELTEGSEERDKLIKDTNSEISEIYDLPIEQKKLPFEIPEEKDIETGKNKDESADNTDA